jgi:hypothetical protein
VGYNALDFFELGQQRLIVATPQVTSVHDAYAFLKGAVLRTLRHHAERPSDIALLEPAMESKDGVKVSALLADIHQKDPAFGAKVERILRHFGAFLVGNQLSRPEEAGVFQAVAKLARNFLGVELPILGCVPGTARLAGSVNERRAFMERAANDRGGEARAFRGMVDALLAGDMAPEEELLLELIDGEEEEPPGPVTEDSAVAAAASLAPPSELPSAVVKPRLYVRPPRKPRLESDEKKRKRDLDAQNRRRKITLPGMPRPAPRR